MVHINAQLFGPPQLTRMGAKIHFPRRKELGLFAYLAVTCRSHSRESLLALFWPEEGEDQARADLRRVLSSLRRELGAEALEVDRNTVCLSSQADISIDVVRFQSAIKNWHSHPHSSQEVCLDCLVIVSEAVQLYQEELLEGFSLPDSSGFEEWQRSQNLALQIDLTNALNWLADQNARMGNWDQGLAYCQRRVGLDPLNEDAHLQLIRLYFQSGRRSAAILQFNQCRRVLQDELGLAPQEETLRVYQTLLDETSHDEWIHASKFGHEKAHQG